MERARYSHARKEPANQWLQQTSPDAAQSVSCGPLCLLSGFAAEPRVGLAERRPVLSGPSSVHRLWVSASRDRRVSSPSSSIGRRSRSSNALLLKVPGIEQSSLNGHVEFEHLRSGVMCNSSAPPSGVPGIERSTQHECRARSPVHLQFMCSRSPSFMRSPASSAPPTRELPNSCAHPPTVHLQFEHPSFKAHLRRALLASGTTEFESPSARASCAARKSFFLRFAGIERSSLYGLAELARPSVNSSCAARTTFFEGSPASSALCTAAGRVRASLLQQPYATRVPFFTAHRGRAAMCSTGWPSSSARPSTAMCNSNALLRSSPTSSLLGATGWPSSGARPSTAMCNSNALFSRVRGGERACSADLPSFIMLQLRTPFLPRVLRHERVSTDMPWEVEE